MKNKNQLGLTSLLVAGILAAGMSVQSQEAKAGKEGFEKCAGIAKKGMNDCGANGHSCAGKAAKDGDVNEWVYVAEGTCEKIVGGKLVKPKKS